ncbi:uncharacterized protein LOC107043750 [Diachasma alloeum]|uniref:uncharacterized protein LOC107043750 n=1 Tax=Diachasma alloeum TaxID=454923 RepID=UPI00073823B3|nr:uncharacterized protein LOC107043750 [Diachasma alloeum]
MQSRGAGIQEVEEIYKKEEEKTREQLRKIESQCGVMMCRQLLGPWNFSKSTILINCDAEFRNSQLLKDLEISKARLRTLTSFSPTDQELRQHVLAYRAALTTTRNR